MDVGASTRGRESLECGTETWCGWAGVERCVCRELYAPGQHTHDHDHQYLIQPNRPHPMEPTSALEPTRLPPPPPPKPAIASAKADVALALVRASRSPFAARWRSFPPGGGPRRRAHARAHTIQPRPTPQHLPSPSPNISPNHHLGAFERGAEPHSGGVGADVVSDRVRPVFLGGASTRAGCGASHARSVDHHCRPRASRHGESRLGSSTTARICINLISPSRPRRLVTGNQVT